MADRVPLADGDELVIVASCQGWALIEAGHLDDYYRPFAVASAIGAVLATLFWCVAGE